MNTDFFRCGSLSEWKADFPLASFVLIREEVTNLTSVSLIATNELISLNSLLQITTLLNLVSSGIDGACVYDHVRVCR